MVQSERVQSVGEASPLLLSCSKRNSRGARELISASVPRSETDTRSSLSSTVMELGSHLATKLEPFLLMSKSAKGAAAAKLIQDAISAQGVYFFAELLDAPNIKQVR